MLSKKTKQEKTQLEEAIEQVHEEMRSLTADSPEYAKCVDQLDKLYKIKDPKSKDRTVLKDWIPVIGSIGGVLVIIAYESMGHSLTSKAVGFIRKA
ncbi:hypothetical protein PBI_COUNT_36 [Microbacterium phage Count]|nr:hypothetical protein PBI_COUNT_36 [Microbacterium phage Count]